jgi:hypothetical protein
MLTTGTTVTMQYGDSKIVKYRQSKVVKIKLMIATYTTRIHKRIEPHIKWAIMIYSAILRSKHIPFCAGKNGSLVYSAKIRFKETSGSSPGTGGSLGALPGVPGTLRGPPKKVNARNRAASRSKAIFECSFSAQYMIK